MRSYCPAADEITRGAHLRPGDIPSPVIQQVVLNENNYTGHTRICTKTMCQIALGMNYMGECSTASKNCGITYGLS